MCLQNVCYARRRRKAWITSFFKSRFSGDVWKIIQKLCLVYREGLRREEEMQWLCDHRSTSSFTNQLKRLALAITVYSIWKKRNAVIYQTTQATEVAVVARIMEEVRDTVATWRKIPLTKRELAAGNRMGNSSNMFQLEFECTNYKTIS